MKHKLKQNDLNFILDWAHQKGLAEGELRVRWEQELHKARKAAEDEFERGRAFERARLERQGETNLIVD